MRLRPDEVAIIDSTKLPPGMLFTLNIEFHPRGQYTLDDVENKRFRPCDLNSATILFFLWSKRSRSRKGRLPEPIKLKSRRWSKRKRCWKPKNRHRDGRSKPMRGMTS